MSDLIDTIDVAARTLLERAMAPDTDADGKPTLITLADRTKAFDSVVDWAKVKNAFAPPKPATSKFELIRSDFNGAADTNKRRGASRKTAKETAAGGDAAESPDDELFAS